MPPRPHLPTHELYAEQLLPLSLGYALYEPDPSPGRDEVRIGDVGYVYDGRFKRFASVFESGNGITTALEERFREIEPFTDLDEGVLSSNSVRSEGFEGNLSGADPTSGVSAGLSLTFSCQSERGATLIRKYRAKVEKAAIPIKLKRHFAKHIRSLYEFAKSNDFIENLQDIILVTGRIMTGDWATLAFDNHSQERRVSFDVTAATITATGSLWGRWSENITFPKRHGPLRKPGEAIADGQEPIFNQCVFIETCRYYDLSWFDRLNATLRIGRTWKPTVSTVGLWKGSASPSLGTESPLVSGPGGISIDDADPEEMLSAYDVLAFRAFYASDSKFNFICIDEEDIKRSLPSSSTLSSVLETIKNLPGLSVMESDFGEPHSGLWGKVHYGDGLRTDLESVDNIYDENKGELSSKISENRATPEAHPHFRPSIFYRRKRVNKEPYVRPSLFILAEKSAPVNSGPGRTLGSIYNAMGGKVERLTNSFAGRILASAREVLCQDSRQLKLRPRLLTHVHGRVLEEQPYDRPTIDIGTIPRELAAYLRVLQFYGASGSRIEKWLCNVAHHSPSETAQIIRELRRHHVTRTHEFDTDRLTESEEYIVLWIWCKTLLEYTRSSIIETQLEALEAVTDLAVTDLYVRNILIACLHQSYLILPYKNRPPHIASTNALTFVKENEAHYLWTSITHREVDRDVGFPNPLKRIRRVIRDPDVSFLLARHLTIDGADLEDPGVQTVWMTYLDLTRTDPQLIEWGQLNTFLKHLAPESTSYLILLWMTLFCVRPVARCILSILSQQIFPPPTLMSDGKLDVYDTDFNSSVSWRFLSELCGSDDLKEKIFLFRSLDKDMQYVLKDTILGNEIYIAYVHLHHSFTKKPDPFWPHEFGLDAGAHIEEETATLLGLEQYDVDKLRVRNHLPNFRDLVSARAVTAQFLESELNGEDHVISILLISRVMCFNRYFKMALLPVFLSDSYSAVAASSQMGNVLLRPGRGEDRSTLENCEFTDFAQWEFIHVSRSIRDGREKYRKVTLYYFEDSLAWLKVRGNKKPFDVTGHFPICAGPNSSGEERYIAMVSSSTDAGKFYFAYVKDGARTVTYVDRDDNLRVESHFYVLVLQYDPSDIGPPYPQVPEDALHQTGPIYWKYSTEVHTGDEEGVAGFHIVELVDDEEEA